MKTHHPLFILITLLLAACSSQPAWRNASLSPEERAQLLLKELTLEEKVSLMQNNSPAIERLGIKPYEWWNEALHGVGRSGLATVFPQAIGMGASFDEPLLYQVFTAVSDEARAKTTKARSEGNYKRYYGLTFWTPNINIFRDPRWGRGQETYGEDPYLTAQLGMAVVRGLQGPDDAAYDKAHACAKHFAVHSGPEWNRHSFDAADIAPRDLWETYLPAFEALVTQAGVKEVMCAYNRYEGDPCCGSDRLLMQILRDEWNYQGVVVSDCWAIADFYQPGHHATHADSASASSKAVLTGTDLECGNSFQSLVAAARKGQIDEAAIDRALGRLLKARFELGEMEESTPWDSIPYSVVNSAAHQQLALRMACESMTLLQNKNGLLPLKPDMKVALIGPNANDSVMQWGNYNGFPGHTVTLLEALQKRLPQEQLIYTQACDYVKDSLYLSMPQLLKQLAPADVVLFAGGISPKLEGEEMKVSVPGFKGGDRIDIQLPAVQRCLLKALRAAGKRVVMVNFSGSAIGLEPEKSSCDAILQAWYPGQAGGTAIAQVLYGEYNPAGRLPVTFYKDTLQLPDFQDYAMKGRTYRYLQSTPSFAFGHGLSYTTFRYDDARVVDGELVVPVSNVGQRDGEEVVQLYLQRPDDPEGPQLTLRGFRRVFIAAGETKGVRFPLTEETFRWWDAASNTVRPLEGKFRLLYGGTSERSQLKALDFQR